jgi:phage gp46-like protein
MPDISTVWDPVNGQGDYVLVGPDLQAGSDVETAVLISWFTDAEAAEDDVIPDGSGDRRGWWGDLGELYPIGSKLWLLERSKLDASVVALARTYASAAVQWMINDGVCSQIDVVTEQIRPNALGLMGTFHRPGQDPLVLKYQVPWSGVS